MAEFLRKPTNPCGATTKINGLTIITAKQSQTESGSAKQMKRGDEVKTIYLMILVNAVLFISIVPTASAAWVCQIGGGAVSDGACPGSSACSSAGGKCVELAVGTGDNTVGGANRPKAGSHGNLAGKSNLVDTDEPKVKESLTKESKAQETRSRN